MKDASRGGWQSGMILKKKGKEKARFKEKKSEAPNYQRNALTRVRVPRRYTHDLGRVWSERKKKEKKRITRTSRRGWRAVPCDIHVSRLFMTRGTSGRTRTTPLRNATRASNAYIIYREEKKRAGVKWKKIETTPWTRDGLSPSCALCL